MFIGARIRHLRKEKGLSQGDIEARTGLLRCYISRVEHGHTVPSLETMERFAAGLDVPLYQLFYRGEQAPLANNLTSLVSMEELANEDAAGQVEDKFLVKLRNMVNRLSEVDRNALLNLAKALATR